jgi:hypothetical protein
MNKEQRAYWLKGRNAAAELLRRGPELEGKAGESLDELHRNELTSVVDAVLALQPPEDA